MITPSEVTRIGFFSKPHGVSGEVRLEFEADVLETLPSDYIICEMEGILVPFFIESYRLGGGSTGYVKFQRVDDLAYANRFIGVDAYLPKELVSQPRVDNPYDAILGFLVSDEQLGELGRIREVDETTSNVLFVVGYEEREVLIPVHEDLILGIDQAKKIVYVDLPEGLVDLESLD